MDFGNKRGVYFDFGVLAHCDHVIETYGTFSFWAGYLHFQWREKGTGNYIIELSDFMLLFVL